MLIADVPGAEQRIVMRGTARMTPKYSFEIKLYDFDGTYATECVWAPHQPSSTKMKKAFSLLSLLAIIASFSVLTSFSTFVASSLLIQTWICGNRFTLADVLLFCFLEFGASLGQPVDPAKLTDTDELPSHLAPKN